MAVVELLLRTADAMTAHRFPFLLIGGMAVSTWVSPRLTRDVDIVVRARRRDAPRLKKALVACGARATSLEMRLLFERKPVRFSTGGPKLDVWIAATPHDQEAFKNAQTATLQGRTILVASPEDLILYKLQAWRLQDRIDLSNLLGGVRNLRIGYIESWLDPIARETGSPMRDRWMSIRKRT